MTRDRKPRGRKRKRRPNAGSFKPGPDSRRHVFTAQDCRLGYWVAAIKHPHLREWLLLKNRIYYQERSRHGPQEDRGGVGRAARADAGGIGAASTEDGAPRDDDRPY